MQRIFEVVTKYTKTVFSSSTKKERFKIPHAMAPGYTNAIRFSQGQKTSTIVTVEIRHRFLHSAKLRNERI
jgi:cytochrome b involved in lipid metabolism